MHNEGGRKAMTGSTETDPVLGPGTAEERREQLRRLDLAIEHWWRGVAEPMAGSMKVEGGSLYNAGDVQAALREAGGPLLAVAEALRDRLENVGDLHT